MKIAYITYHGPDGYGMRFPATVTTKPYVPIHSMLLESNDFKNGRLIPILWGLSSCTIEIAWIELENDEELPKYYESRRVDPSHLRLRELLDIKLKKEVWET